ncbi:hypothetical protein PINS_up010734 [Pythium insidiosum]|nr:hypothetical protein PINS_up010734 [Pythium insidiosum]
MVSMRPMIAAVSRRLVGSQATLAQRAAASSSAPLLVRRGAVVSTSDDHASMWLAAVLLSVGGATVALSEPKRTISAGAGAGASPDAVKDADAEAHAEPKPRGGRRALLKSRTRHKAKLEEVDLMKLHVDEYREARATIDSLAKRFELFASKTIETPGKKVPAMTYTDFLQSMVLPRFHAQKPKPELEYSCEFAGNADGLITYEECYLLIHLLQIPQEHFEVAFHMFDLDGDGSVDKNEFCHVIENLLHAISVQHDNKPLAIEGEELLPRMVKYLFGRFGKKKIRASDLAAALEALRRDILRAEFDLYARPHPTKKGTSVISVHDFAITLVSGFDPDRLAPYLERVEALNASEELVTWEDFYKFHANVQNNLADIKLAFDLTHAEEITEADFIRAARVVSGVELSFPVVQLAFRVFDSNENGTLDQSELLKVLETRSTIELTQRPPENKLQRFVSCVKRRED